MKIAILGWGYLIWDPRGMDLAPEWHADGPLLPIEFARFSSGPVQIATPFRQLVRRELGWE